MEDRNNWCGVEEPGKQDRKKINISDVNHPTVRKTSHITSVLPCLEDADAVNVTGAVCDKLDQQTSDREEDGEITRWFTVGGYVNGIYAITTILYLQ